MRNAQHANRFGFGLAWVVANAAGYGLSLMLWEAVSRPLWPALSGIFSGSVTLVLFGVTLGLGAGLAQAVALRSRWRSAGFWVVASTWGLGLGFAAGAWVAFVVSRNGAIDAVTNLLYTSSGRLAGTLFRESLVNIAFGLVAGAGIGVARWLLLCTTGAAAARWIPVSAVAIAVGFGLADGMIQLVPPLPPAVYGVFFGAFGGAIIGLIEWLWLHQRTGVWPLVSTALAAREPLYAA